MMLLSRTFTLLFAVFASFSFVIFAQAETDSALVALLYNKQELYIPMRDGVKLFTVIYSPKDTTKAVPILFNRTTYNVAPYGEGKYKTLIGPTLDYVKAGYIFVYQDVRGRFMSEGEFEHVRPYIPNKKSNNDVDESSDAYDTIEWLIKNLKHHNGNVGMWGISYPGFYAVMGAIDAHPNLKAVSPQAPIADWFIGDDFHQNGALLLLPSYPFLYVMGLPHPEPRTTWQAGLNIPTPDGYDFYLREGPLSNLTKKLPKSIAFWNSIMQNDTYTQFWKERSTLPHLKDIRPAVLTVGGWFDAEDCYGALQTYKHIEKQTPGNDARLVMGPWFHGGWVRSQGDRLGEVSFSVETSEKYMSEIEFPFFEHYLRGSVSHKLPEAMMFNTGSHTWHGFEQWPPKEIKPTTLYLTSEGGITLNKPIHDNPRFTEFISDPNRPVPHSQVITNRMTREYIVEDQRFASRRPDVLVFSSEVLDRDITLAGEISADLFVSTTGTDADWVVKIIDVYPDSMENFTFNSPGVQMGGYQFPVRMGLMRGKFRESFEIAKPFTPDSVTQVQFALNDILHTFKKGHRIMIQIQSTMFPLIDRNPQVFTKISEATPEMFTKQTHRIWMGPQFPSGIKMGVLPNP